MQILFTPLRTLLLVTVAVLTCAPRASAQDTQRNYRLDTIFNPSASAGVNAFAVLPDGKILVGDYDGLARLNVDGSVDADFHPGLPYVSVDSLALQPDGKILVGGYFGPEDGTAPSNIARLNADGSLDSSFTASADGRDFDVTSVLAQPDGKILLSGQFATVDRTPVSNGFARVNRDGSLDTAFVANVTAAFGQSAGINSAIGLQADGKILIAVDFTSDGMTFQPGVRRLNPDGTLDATFYVSTTDGDGFGSIYVITPQPDGRVLLGGAFAAVNGVAQPNLARVNADGSLDATFTPTITDPTSYLTVNALAVQPDGKIVVGGQFSEVNGVAASNLVRLRIDGTRDPSFIANVNAPHASGGAVNTVVLQPDSKILVGGNFDAVNNAPRANVARLNPDPTITIEALDTLISDSDGSPGRFKLLRSGQAEGTLTINLKLRSSALNGTDYSVRNLPAGLRDLTKTFKAGKAKKGLTVDPINVGNGSGQQKGVKVKLAPGDGYIVGEPSSAKLKIADQ